MMAVAGLKRDRIYHIYILSCYHEAGLADSLPNPSLVSPVSLLQTDMPK